MVVEVKVFSQRAKIVTLAGRDQYFAGKSIWFHVHMPQTICHGVLTKLLISERLNIFLWISKERRKSDLNPLSPQVIRGF
jgi:hypothetical protein